MAQSEQASAAEKGQALPAEQTRHPFLGLRQEFDRLFDEFDRNWRLPFARNWFEREPLMQGRSEPSARPAADVAEKDDAFEVSVELPGIEEDQIDVTVANGLLSIKAEKSEEKEEKKKGYYLTERRYGTFQRSFALPEGVDADKIEGTFKNGVLSLHLPKKPELKEPAKKISVKAS